MKVNIGKYPKNGNDRKISINIENYDTWNLDHTLALIIHPSLVLFKKNQLSGPYTDNEDLPEHLHYDEDYNSNTTHPLHFERWDWILDEMIFAFEQIANENTCLTNFCSGEFEFDFVPVDKNHQETTKELSVGYKIVERDSSTHKFDEEAYQQHMNRIKNGLRLFSKYYFGLWN